MIQESLYDSWIAPLNLDAYDFQYPLVLWAIPGVALLFLAQWLTRYLLRQKLSVALPEQFLRTDPVTYLRFVPPFFMMAAMAFMLIAIARPQQTSEEVEQYAEGIDIVLALDISESMRFEDFRPNRLEAAKRTAQQFVDGRFQDRIGIIIFSGQAISYAPLTTDYDFLRELIENLRFDLIDKGGTAIGNALGVSANRLSESDAKSKVIILLTDGESNAGNIPPMTAANIAYGLGIKVYTIGIGSKEDVVYRGNRFRQSLDMDLLREIAELTGGQAFPATDNEALEKVFARIDEMEKVEIKETRYRDTKDCYHIFLYWAMACWLLWFFFKLTPFANVLED